MSEIDVIRYLLDEIEKEEEYNANYEMAKEKAEYESEGTRYWYGRFMPSHFYRQPRTSVIKANAKKIRQLALKLY